MKVVPYPQTTTQNLVQQSLQVQLSDTQNIDFCEETTAGQISKHENKLKPILISNIIPMQQSGFYSSTVLQEQLDHDMLKSAQNDNQDNQLQQNQFPLGMMLSIQSNQEHYFSEDQDLQEVTSQQNILPQSDEQTIQNQENDRFRKKTASSITNYFVIFRWNYFFEFIFYHFTYYSFIGPLCFFFFYFAPGTTLLYNMQFIGCTFFMIQQAGMYIFNVGAQVMYYYRQSANIYIYGELMFIYIGMLLRSATIAIKYATFDPEYIAFIRKRRLRTEDVTEKMFLLNWLNQDDGVIYDEVRTVLRRNDIDECMFYLNFFKGPNETIADKLRQNCIDLEKYHKETFTKFQPDPMILLHHPESTDYNFYGFGIMKLLIERFEKQNAAFRNIFINITFIYSIYRGQVPCMCRYYEGKPYLGDGWYQAVEILAMMLPMIYVYSTTTMTLALGSFNMMRTNYLLTQMSHMLSPRKIQQLDLEKYLPTINFLCPIILKGWLTLRRVCQEYGRQYLLRVYALAALTFIYCICSLIFLLLGVFQAIHFKEIAFLVGLFSDVILMSILFMMILYQGAIINTKYKEHIEILRSNKGIIADLYTNRNIYFSENYLSNTYIYRKIVEKVHQRKYQNQEQLSFELKLALRSYDELIHDLQNEEQMAPFKILGITVTFGILESIFIGIVSGLSTIVGYIATFRKSADGVTGTSV